MQNDWSSSLDLLVPLTTELGRREAIELALRERIRDGRLAGGRALPSSRALARDLGVARGTVMAAYEQLAAEGYLVTKPGAATIVAAPASPATLPRRRASVADRPRFDFFPGHPDLSAFPRADWAAAVRAVLRDTPDAAFGYGDPRGSRVLREELAIYLGRARGVASSADDIVVCGGFSEGLAMLCRIFRRNGASHIALEDPCLPRFREIATSAGLSVVPAPVDHLGATVPRDEGVAAVVVTPAHQSPTGITLAAERRAELVAWAHASDAFIIEDDYDGEFRYDRQPVGALQGLAPSRVLYAGTASKTFAPGLRVGWLAVPSSLVEPLAGAQEHGSPPPSILDQLTLARLLATGRFDRHIRRMRSRYRIRRDRLVRAISEAAPGIRIRGVSAGLHLLLELPSDGPGAAGLAAEARTRGIGLWATDYFWQNRGPWDGICVGYGAIPEHDVPSAINALATLLHDSYG